MSCVCNGTTQERQSRWVVHIRRANRSAFNGGHRTPSEHSGVMCRRCGYVWRTRAAYVDSLPDGSLWDLDDDRPPRELLDRAKAVGLSPTTCQINERRAGRGVRYDTVYRWSAGGMSGPLVCWSEPGGLYLAYAPGNSTPLASGAEEEVLRAVVEHLEQTTDTIAPQHPGRDP